MEKKFHRISINPSLTNVNVIHMAAGSGQKLLINFSEFFHQSFTDTKLPTKLGRPLPHSFSCLRLLVYVVKRSHLVVGRFSVILFRENPSTSKSLRMSKNPITKVRNFRINAGKFRNSTSYPPTNHSNLQSGFSCQRTATISLASIMSGHSSCTNHSFSDVITLRFVRIFASIVGHKRYSDFLQNIGQVSARSLKYQNR